MFAYKKSIDNMITLMLILFLILKTVIAQNPQEKYSTDTCGVSYNLVGNVFNEVETGRFEHPW